MPAGRPKIFKEKMETIIAIKVPDELALKIALAAKKKKISQGELIRNLILANIP